MARLFVAANSDRIVTSINAGLTFNNPFSMGCWAYATSSQGSVAARLISTLVGSSPFDGAQISWAEVGTGSADEMFVSIVSTTGLTLNKWAQTSQTTNTWWHLLFTYDGSNTLAGLQLYRNGSVLSPTSSNGSSTGSFTNRAFNIGSNTDNAKFFDGRIADAAVWNVALTASEVAGLGRGLRPWMVRPKSLIRYWPLDGLQSPEPDLSGNAANGTLTGTAKANGPPIALFTLMKPTIDAVVAAGPSPTMVFQQQIVGIPFGGPVSVRFPIQ